MMRNDKGVNRVLLLLVFFLVAFTGEMYGQRYLSDVFPEEVMSIRNVVYGEAVNYRDSNELLYFDFYEPAEDTLARRPLLIYAHGGGFTGGSRKLSSIELMGEKLARRGYAFATISYRTDPRFDYFNSEDDKRAVSDAMHDMKAAIRFFKSRSEEYRIDTAHIFIGGESAGGVTAMVAGYVDKQPEMEAYPKSEPNDVEGNSGTPGYSSDVQGVLCLCAAIPDTVAIDSSDNSALMVIHGTKDPMVPVEWAEDIIQRAENMGLRHEKVFFDGATHCPWIISLPNWEAYLDSTVNYMSHFMYSLITGETPPPLKKAPPPMQVANIIQNNMVIQQLEPFKVSGFSSLPGDTVEIIAGWTKKPFYTYASQDREWAVSVPVPEAVPGEMTPYELMVISRKDTIKYSNILIGEVWFCAGQSNMDMKIRKITGWYDGVVDYEEVVKNAHFPAIRLLNLGTRCTTSPRDNFSEGKWEVCSPERAGNFSAVAYFFGKAIHQQLDIPVGLVVAAAVGATAQAFISREPLENDPLLKEEYWEKYRLAIDSQEKIDSMNFFTKELQMSDKPGFTCL